MRIGILTYHFVPNFGANLQTLATIEYLKKKGHSPIVINWQPTAVIKEYEERVPLIQRKVHLKFLTDFYPMTEVCISDKDIIHEIKRNKIEAIIVGSDVVLRYSLWKSEIRIFQGRMPFRWIKRTPDVKFPNPFWLNFLTNDPELTNLPTALMSASSMGSNFIEIPAKVKRRMNTQLEQFNYISVRDSWTREMVKAISLNTITPEITPDPVFGFNKNIGNESTREEILKKFNLPDKYIVISFRNNYVTPQWINDFEKISEKENYKCVELAVPEGTLDFQLKQKIDIPLSPLDWYNIIRYSSGYVGQNMHPIVICIHNCIPFYSFDDYGDSHEEHKNAIPSKIFDLLHRMSFTEYCLNVRADKGNLIAPEKLLSLLNKFNYKKCENISKQLNKDYDFMMENMIKSLSTVKTNNRI